MSLGAAGFASSAMTAVARSHPMEARLMIRSSSNGRIRASTGDWQLDRFDFIGTGAQRLALLGDRFFFQQIHFAEAARLTEKGNRRFCLGTFDFIHPKQHIGPV